MPLRQDWTRCPNHHKCAVSMRQKFLKMHGLGNDFVILDGRGERLPAISSSIASGLANRKTGIGCDQLIVLEQSDTADFRMRIYNADGGEVEACGNASRAVALLHGSMANVETGGGMITLSPNADGKGATVDMGKPRFDWQDIPLEFAMDTLTMPVSWGPLENPVSVNVGNPHVIFFVDDCDAIALEELGPLIEQDPLFPERVNVNVASVQNAEIGAGVSEASLRLRVWERGVGETRACGTGACATAIAAMRRGIVSRCVNVTLPGGTLQIEWDDNDHIQMSGPASTSFAGSFDWDDFS